MASEFSILYKFPKGANVRLKSENGGEIVAPLYSGYRPSYDAVLVLNGEAVVIPAMRIKSVEAVQFFA